jgi:hypothetical protein
MNGPASSKAAAGKAPVQNGPPAHQAQAAAASAKPSAAAPAAKLSLMDRLKGMMPGWKK